MTEPVGPQLAPTSHRSGAIAFFGIVALLWTVWLGGLVSVASDQELYLFLWCGSALLALVSLYVGLKRRRSVLRVGGFILFAISLGKIFLYDLPSLSSVQRAFSFLAVGAGLLLGGFFYQRLSAQFDER